jgi:hypothetical protein
MPYLSELPMARCPMNQQDEPVALPLHLDIVLSLAGSPA